jgi:hypothetical protein
VVHVAVDAEADVAGVDAVAVAADPELAVGLARAGFGRGAGLVGDCGSRAVWEGSVGAVVVVELDEGVELVLELDEVGR